MAGSQFSFQKSRLERALFQGMYLSEHANIVCDRNEGIHYFFLPALDSGIVDNSWGRLRFALTLPENCVCYLYTMASNAKEAEDILQNPAIALNDKKRYLSGQRCLRFINQPDVLLYEIEGRYLWIAMEVIGVDVTISDITVWTPGDQFMDAFPEVYREKNSFFHRFLSIFSSMYNDLQDCIDHSDDWLDIDKAPQALLERYLGWMGIDVDGGFLDRDMMRAFLKEAGTLIPYKGTPRSIERLCEIFVGEKPVIVERNLMQEYVKGADRTIYDLLYGSSPYDVTLLLERTIDVHRKEQLMHLLRQFKPVRSRLHIVFLEKSGVLDGYSFLDKNAVLFTQKEGVADCLALFDAAVVLA